MNLFFSNTRSPEKSYNPSRGRRESRSHALRQGLSGLAAGFALMATAHAQAPAQPWTEIATPALRAFHPTEPVRVELPNGIQIFLEEDHELPFIDGFLRVRGGSRDVPADKVGLVSLYGQAWRTSGTPTHPGDALDDLLAAKAAHVETSGGQAATSISFSGFASDFDQLLGISLDLLQHPKFQQGKLDLAKQGMIAGILRRNDDSGEIADRQVLRLAYGPDNPYGRDAELATVKAVTLADLTVWHSRTVVGANIIVGIIGDFDAKAMEAKLRAALASLPRGTALASPTPTFTDPKPGVYFANKTDVNQSTVVLVGLGTREDNPDYYALSVMNEVFSGGFGSRIVQNIRTKLGLAYEVDGKFGAAYDHPGLFAVELGTKSSSTVPAAKATLQEVGRLRSDPPTDSELKAAKDDLLNSFIFRYDTPEKVLNEQVTLAVYGYPADFLDRYRAGVEKVTSADVSRVAQKYIQPEKLAIVVVGNGPTIEPPLAGLGAVTPLDLTIPGAPQQQAPQ